MPKSKKYFTLFICWFPIVVIALFSLFWITSAYNANNDAADGRHMLFMDELISFDGVKRIEAAETSEKLIDNIIGPDQRYGRTFWYFTYPVAKIGGWLNGDKGRIVSTRMAFAMILYIGIAILIWALIDSYIARMLSLIVALSLPYVSYYAVMPKPEPIIFFFLGISLLIFRKFPKAGLLFFYVLGIAFGTKISAVPVAVLFGLGFLWRAFSLDRLGIKLVVKAMLGIVLGWITAVPIIAVNGKAGLDQYIAKTWLNRSHGSDRSDIGPDDWMSYIEKSDYFGQGVITWWVLVLFLVLGVLPLIIRFCQTGNLISLRSLKDQAVSHEFIVAMVSVTGVILVTSILVSAKRLWGFYLLPGSVLIVIAAIAGAERLVLSGYINLKIKILVIVTLLAATSACAYYGLKNNYLDFKRNATRSQSDKYRIQNERYEMIMAVSETLNASLDRPISVRHGAHFWFPKSNELVRYHEFYITFNIWKEKHDILVLAANHITSNTSANLPDKYRERAKLSYEQLLSHSTFGGSCTSEPCYQYFKPIKTDLHIMIRDDNVNSEIVSFLRDNL